ncbi:hypothetical protein AB0C38_10315 [Amycolatopsis sp. NPDC048633]|uniref:hypothetical protein n=1 Tax=Amycolatopsis sp. NPDC048633 TaxID=3157095 RepID=UPI0033EAEC1F
MGEPAEFQFSEDERRQPQFGERVVAWHRLDDEGRSADDSTIEGSCGEGPDEERAEAELNRWRGLVMAQAAEVEAVLGVMVRMLDPNAKVDIAAGLLLNKLRKLLIPLDFLHEYHDADLDDIARAIKARNKAVHGTARVGYSWVDYQTGGGEWMQVISLVGDQDWSELELRWCLSMQQRAAFDAVYLMDQLRDHLRSRAEPASSS